MTRKMKQLHVWVTDNDHMKLTALANECELTVGAVVRNLIRQATSINSVTTAGVTRLTASDKRWSPKS
jgi:hypothetical protein